jgi:hypothetical protein
MYIYLKSVAISFRLCVFAFLFISISSRSSKILIVSLLVGEALVGSSKIKKIEKLNQRCVNGRIT